MMGAKEFRDPFLIVERSAQLMMEDHEDTKQLDSVAFEYLPSVVRGIKRRRLTAETVTHPHFKLSFVHFHGGSMLQRKQTLRYRDFHVFDYKSHVGFKELLVVMKS